MFPKVIFLSSSSEFPKVKIETIETCLELNLPVESFLLIKKFIFICSRCHSLLKNSLLCSFKERKQTCAIFSQFGLQTDSCRRSVFKNQHIFQITDDMINGF